MSVPGVATDGAATDPRRMEDRIALVLRAGVVLSGSVIFVGLALLLLHGASAEEPRSVVDMLAAETHPTSPSAIVAGLTAGRPTSIVRLGVLLLVLTPVARVAMTLAMFLVLRDRVFVLVTALVLAILLLGVAGIG